MLDIPFWCFYFIRFAQASQYVTNSLESVQLLEKDSHDIGARSSIECILKCGNWFQKKGFYTNDKSCFCLNGTTSDRAGKSKGGFDGNLYLKREIESKLIFFSFENPSQLEFYHHAIRQRISRNGVSTGGRRRFWLPLTFLRPKVLTVAPNLHFLWPYSR